MNEHITAAQTMRKIREEADLRKNDIYALEMMKQLEKKKRRKLKMLHIDDRTVVYATPRLLHDYKKNFKNQ